jgi:acyl-CoA synthetase (AMP-forming)/AMP-acid ligase II
MVPILHDLPATIPHVIARTSLRHPHATAVEDQGRRITFTELGQACNRAAIAQVAVIGVPNRRMGEVGKAFIVLRPDAECDLESIENWCRENMANYKVPRYLERVTALPTTASGKVQKFALR